MKQNSVNISGSGSKTEASKTHLGRFDSWKYSAEVIYSWYDQDSDSGDDEDICGVGKEQEGGQTSVTRGLRAPWYQEKNPAGKPSQCC